MVSRRRFFGVIPLPLLGSAARAAVASPVVVPVEVIRLFVNDDEVEKFATLKRLFPGGIAVTRENVETLRRELGWSVQTIIEKGIPVSGHFEENDDQRWYRDGRLHRLDGPAVIRADGTQYWYQDGKLHRLDGPAITHADGTQEWYRDGKLHRVGGPAFIRADGTQCWYRDSFPHRSDGPAIIDADGAQQWCRDGKLHRLGGPAVTRVDGTQQWYRDGKSVYRPAD